MPDYFASSLTLARTEPERGNRLPTFDSSAHSVHAVASARIYHAHLNAKETDWSYSRLRGTLRFGRDWSAGGTTVNAKNDDESDQHWFSLVDEDTGNTVWMFKIPIGFRYEVDRPFFHVFSGRTRKYGFRFEDDDEATVFSRKVISQTSKERAPPTFLSLFMQTQVWTTSAVTKRARSLKAKTSSSHVHSKSLSSSKISASMISSPAPNSFKHVAHVGVNQNGVFEASKDVDPSFKDMLLQLQNYGISEALVIEHISQS